MFSIFLAYEFATRIIVLYFIILVFGVISKMIFYILKSMFYPFQIARKNFFLLLLNIMGVGVILFGICFAIGFAFEVDSDKITLNITLIAIVFSSVLKELSIMMYGGLCILNHGTFSIGDTIEVNSNGKREIKGIVIEINLTNVIIINMDKKIEEVPSSFFIYYSVIVLKKEE